MRKFFTSNKMQEISKHLKLIFIIIGAGIVVASTYFSNRLGNSLAQEEKRKIEIWAEATRQLILSDETTNLDFIISIIEGNVTIPVILVDEKDQLLSSKNVKEPSKDLETFYRKEIYRLKQKNPAIEVKLGESSQFIYYDDSSLLKQLYYFPSLARLFLLC